MHINPAPPSRRVHQLLQLENLINHQLHIHIILLRQPLHQRINPI